jgi:hypothetical protein
MILSEERDSRALSKTADQVGDDNLKRRRSRTAEKKLGGDHAHDCDDREFRPIAKLAASVLRLHPIRSGFDPGGCKERVLSLFQIVTAFRHQSRPTNLSCSV